MDNKKSQQALKKHMVFIDTGAAANHLEKGGLLIYATETFCALGCKADCHEAVTAIFKAKGRPASKPLPLIAADIEQAAAIANLELAPPEITNRFWPGPLALLLPARTALLPALVNRQNKVCLRVTSAAQAAALAKSAGFALVATSANLSGCSPVRNLAGLDPAFLASLDQLKVAWGIFQPEWQDSSQFAKPSTIIEPERQDNRAILRVLRSGCIPLDLLKNKNWDII